MSEVYTMSLWLHLMFIKILLILLIVHLCLVFIGDTSKFSYIKRLMYFLPTYYVFMAFVFFTGILNLSILYFHLNFRIIIMIIFWIALIPLGAIGFKKLKQVRLTKDFKKFKFFMLIKIICEMILVIVATIIGIKF